MSNRFTSRCVATLCLLSLFLLPSLGAAQSNGEGATVAGVYSGTSSIYSTIIGLPITTTVGVVLLILMLTKNSSAQLEHHLNHHREDVQAALYTHDTAQSGAEDLAFLFGVSSAHRQDFAELLISERDTLAPLLQDEVVTSEEAYTFGMHIATLMQAHPTLSEDVQRQLDAYQHAQAAQ